VTNVTPNNSTDTKNCDLCADWQDEHGTPAQLVLRKNVKPRVLRYFAMSDTNSRIFPTLYGRRALAANLAQAPASSGTPFGHDSGFGLFVEPEWRRERETFNGIQALVESRRRERRATSIDPLSSRIVSAPGRAVEMRSHTSLALGRSVGIARVHRA
jgi:hypothetical protein